MVERRVRDFPREVSSRSESGHQRRIRFPEHFVVEAPLLVGLCLDDTPVLVSGDGAANGGLADWPKFRVENWTEQPSHAKGEIVKHAKEMVGGVASRHEQINEVLARCEGDHLGSKTRVGFVSSFTAQTLLGGLFIVLRYVGFHRLGPGALGQERVGAACVNPGKLPIEHLGLGGLVTGGDYLVGRSRFSGVERLLFLRLGVLAVVDAVFAQVLAVAVVHFDWILLPLLSGKKDNPNRPDPLRVYWRRTARVFEGYLWGNTPVEKSLAILLAVDPESFSEALALQALWKWLLR